MGRSVKREIWEGMGLSMNGISQRPLKALDLFCGAGGVSWGLICAGFDVTGVDIKPQKNYVQHGRFIQGDALTFPLQGFDFIWASPPCQAHTSLKSMHNAKKHEDLIPATRARLEASGTPWVMENVPGSPLKAGLLLCGTMFGLGSVDAELRRHRHFETSFDMPLMGLPRCCHGRRPRVIGVYGGHGRDRRRTVNARDYSTEERREAMGIPWMSGMELSQAIPPAYSEFIARQFFCSQSTKAQS